MRAEDSNGSGEGAIRKVRPLQDPTGQSMDLFLLDAGHLQGWLSETANPTPVKHPATPPQARPALWLTLRALPAHLTMPWLLPVMDDGWSLPHLLREALHACYVHGGTQPARRPAHNSHSTHQVSTRER